LKKYLFVNAIYGALGQETDDSTAAHAIMAALSEIKSNELTQSMRAIKIMALEGILIKQLSQCQSEANYNLPNDRLNAIRKLINLQEFLIDKYEKGKVEKEKELCLNQVSLHGNSRAIINQANKQSVSRNE
jgi:hypothetical protein